MRIICLSLAACAAFAQGTDPKPKPEDYPVHAQISVLGQPVTLGAEFDVHSFSRGEEMYVAPEFLVVEVAFYPPKGTRIDVSPPQFTLRVNGRKQPLLAQPPGLVASALSHPEWQNRPRVMAGGGMGGIGIGTPAQGPQQRNPPQAPRDDPSDGLAQKPRVSASDLALQTALPQGEFKAPVSGYIYFDYRGKISSIKSLVLYYQDTAISLR